MYPDNREKYTVSRCSRPRVRVRRRRSACARNSQLDTGARHGAARVRRVQGLEAEEGVAECAGGEQQRDELRGDVERIVAGDAADGQRPRERA